MDLPLKLCITKGNRCRYAEITLAYDVIPSLNVLVRVQGSAPSLHGVLLSAHFDSVSTGYGIVSGLLHFMRWG